MIERTDDLNKMAFMNALTYMSATNDEFVIDCDYGSPTGISIRYAEKQNWAIVVNLHFIRYISSYHAERDGNDATLSRFRYTLNLTEEGKTLFDFHQL